jgi:hypothetical protein
MIGPLPRRRSHEDPSALRGQERRVAFPGRRDRIRGVARSGRLSKRLPATGIIFREVQPDYDLDWHPAPRRQYIINLDAGVQITASDGEARRIGAGEVLLVEDTHGKGHLSKALDGKLRNCIFVTLE